jgi:hypothetical protein
MRQAAAGLGFPSPVHPGRWWRGGRRRRARAVA